MVAWYGNSGTPPVEVVGPFVVVAAVLVVAVDVTEDWLVEA